MTATHSARPRPEIKTLANLEAAFAGESMAHIKYRYFARLACEMGDEETARAFSWRPPARKSCTPSATSICSTPRPP